MVLVIMYVKTFKTNIIVFICNIIMVLLTNNLQYQSKSVDTENISLSEINENMYQLPIVYFSLNPISDIGIH